MKKLTGTIDQKTRKTLKAGEELLYTGIVYTARDQAHKRLSETIEKRKKLPFDLNNAIIYYTGPTPSKEKNKVGSSGPTTSSRMDKFTPLLLNKGVGSLIGKGSRSKEVVNAIKKNKAVYFITIAGAGAYLSKRIKSAEIVAYSELGAEAIRLLYVEDFPLIVAVDSHGNSIY
ncbi:MAG: FumA C-terminus/TtdB family hydratase beta subunit [Candidatus Omnitrophica bacterium]|nr:FumA C-terminus/TtdB family hydratase beta subunit [Candidatus Omnitrophota bacterium]